MSKRHEQSTPGPISPHIAYPTTFGTASECTAISIFDLLDMELKTAIANPVVKPSLGIIDPSTLATLPPEIVAANAFDVFSHATDSYTALPYTKRERTPDPTMRPISQGTNPMSKINCLKAIRLIGANLIDAVKNPSPDHHETLTFSGMLGSIGFGNAGCHMPCPMRWLAWGATTRHRAGNPIIRWYRTAFPSSSTHRPSSAEPARPARSAT